MWQPKCWSVLRWRGGALRGAFSHLICVGLLSIHHHLPLSFVGFLAPCYSNQKLSAENSNVLRSNYIKVCLAFSWDQNAMHSRFNCLSFSFLQRCLQTEITSNMYIAPIQELLRDTKDYFDTHSSHRKARRYVARVGIAEGNKSAIPVEYTCIREGK